jgi:hypothetical protein
MWFTSSNYTELIRCFKIKAPKVILKCWKPTLFLLCQNKLNLLAKSEWCFTPMKRHLKNKCWSYTSPNGWYAFENVCYTKGTEHKQTLEYNFTYFLPCKSLAAAISSVPVPSNLRVSTFSFTVISIHYVWDVKTVGSSIKFNNFNAMFHWNQGILWESLQLLWENTSPTNINLQNQITPYSNNTYIRKDT